MLKLLLADRSTTVVLLWILVPCFALCACVSVWNPEIEFFSFSPDDLSITFAILILWYALRFAQMNHDHEKRPL